jgi:protocatechuate 3,4-dioxygenase beta subunit
MTSRRTFLAGAIALAAAACSDSEGDSAGQTTSTSATPTTSTDDSATTEPTTGGSGDSQADVAPLTVAAFEALAVCAMAPAQTAGPFPSLERLERQDITEGYPGHPLRLGLRVVDQACEPVPGAKVEIWHTDATGDYSSYEDGGSGKDEGEGTTFLRGTQTANADGIVEFQTIYPGWYGGRAVHIHVIASVDGRDIHTTQLYFDEGYTDAVHATGEYAQFGPPDTSWDDDRIIGDPDTDGSGIVLSPAATAAGQGTLGLINLGVPI